MDLPTHRLTVRCGAETAESWSCDRRVAAFVKVTCDVMVVTEFSRAAADQVRGVQYLFPQFIVLLQEPQSSGLKTSQQDLQFLLQFSCSSSLCRHVTAVHLKESGGFRGLKTHTVVKGNSLM